MSAQVAFAAAATVIAVAFAFATFDRWQISRRRHEAAWTVALVLFAAAAGALWLGAGTGWDSPTFRAFYYLGAIANVPVLALGTIELLAGARWGRRCAIAVGAFCLFSAGVLTVAPLEGALAADELPRGADVFGPLPRVLAAVGSGVAATVIFAGAVLSMVRLLRARAPRRLAGANGLIATGTVVLSLGGLFNSVASEMTSFALSLVVGISFIFAGFLMATVASSPAASPRRRLQAVPDTAPPGDRDERPTPQRSTSG